MTDVAAVIVTYNSAHVVGQLLDSLPDALDGMSAQVVVVDNGSSDGTVGSGATSTRCHVAASSIER